MLDVELSTTFEYYDENFPNMHKINKGTQRHLKIQMFSQKMMENLINDLLDLAKIENNSFNISTEYFDLGALIYEAL